MRRAEPRPAPRAGPVKPDRPDVMAADWTDPDDIKPNASHVPRRISGWRTYCPLRRMMVNRQSGVTAAHVMAADRLRESFDLARLGYTADRPLLFVSLPPQPRAGLTGADRARCAAFRDRDRALRLFSPSQLRLLEAVVVRNVSLHAWCRDQSTRSARFDAAVEKGRLLAILEVLAVYYQGEIREDLDHGRRLVS